MISSLVRESRLPVGSSARIDVRIVDQGAGDGDALLLAAGELRRAVFQPVAQADQSGQLDAALARLRCPAAGPGRAAAPRCSRPPCTAASRLYDWKMKPR